MKRFAWLALLAVIALPALAQNQPSYQGLWWNSPANSESGWGINITHQGSILFATWFTYDTDGNGMWLVMPRGELQSDGMDSDPYGYGYPMARTTYEYMGTLYRTTGPAFSASTFDSSAVNVTPVGEATLLFKSPDSGSFTYTVNGVTQSKAIVRQVFATPPTCALGGTPADNFQDLWWHSPANSESGWGLNVAHQGDIVFATWFTYDASGKGMWLVLPRGERTTGNTFSGALYRTSGPAFNAQPWSGDKVKVDPVGTATLAFSDASNGTFTATVNGITISKAITREVFASPPSVCR